jgi:ketosteroid isomerase-like protein
MYHYIVLRITRRNFERLNRGDYESVLRDVAPDIVHTISGNHPFGGARHSISAMRRRFERLFVIPQLHFTFHSLVSSRWPWATNIAIEWTDRAEPADGS